MSEKPKEPELTEYQKQILKNLLSADWEKVFKMDYKSKEYADFCATLSIEPGHHPKWLAGEISRIQDNYKSKRNGYHALIDLEDVCVENFGLTYGLP